MRPLHLTESCMQKAQKFFIRPSVGSLKKYSTKIIGENNEFTREN